jgi:hypothetical protein
LNNEDQDENTQSRWDGRCMDPSLGMFRKAVDYALAQGLAWEFMPELRSENGVLHAIRPSGKKLRLQDVIGWEQRSGYAKLVDEMVSMMRAKRPSDEEIVISSHPRLAAKT